MLRALPSLAMLALLVGCEKPEPPAPPAPQSGAISDLYLEKLQEAEALKHSIEQRNLEQQRIDELIGPGQARPVVR